MALLSTKAHDLFFRPLVYIDASVIFIFISIMVGCAHAGTVVSKPDFFQLPLPTYSRSECSPDPEEDERGLYISLPAQVTLLDDVGSLPLCGNYQLSSKVVNAMQGSLIEGTVIVFVNELTGSSFSFSLKPDKEPVEKDADESLSTVESSFNTPVVDEYLTNTYFNIDVLDFFPEFPEVKAKYSVYAICQGIKSNSVEVKVDF